MTYNFMVEPKPKNHEYLATPANTWLFDVDGVITNPETKKVTEPGIITEILKRLEKNEPVSIVSGRALPWLRREVIALIENGVSDKQMLRNLFVSAEFGGISVRFEDGKEIEEIDSTVSLRHDLLQELSQAVTSQFGDVVFIDTEKVTHFTAELNSGLTVDEFKPRQRELSERLSGIVQNFPEKDELEVHNDRIATNVKNKNLNKHLAVRKVLGWLLEREIQPQSFQVFGDSSSDFEMGRELLSQEKNFTFIYVGEKVPDDLPFEVVHQGGVDKGTVEYLKSN